MNTATATRTKRPPKSAPVRTKLTDFPEVVAARAKFVELRKHLHELEQQHVALLAKAGHPAGHAAEVRVRAEQFLAGEGNDVAPDVRAELGELGQDIETVAAAIKLQNGRLGAAVQVASKEICRNRFAEHREIVERVDRALGELDLALRAEEQFRGALSSAGIHVLGPIVSAELQVRFPRYGQRTLARGRKSWRRRLEAQGYFQTEGNSNGS